MVAALSTSLTCPRRSTHLPPRASSARARATCSSRGRIHLYGAELTSRPAHVSWPPMEGLVAHRLLKRLELNIAPAFYPPCKSDVNFSTLQARVLRTSALVAVFFDVDCSGKGTHIVQPGTTLQHAVVGPPNLPLLTCRRQSQPRRHDEAAACIPAKRGVGLGSHVDGACPVGSVRCMQKKH